MAEPVPVPEGLGSWGHGLYYVHRDASWRTRLDQQVCGGMPVLPRPERDVLRALLLWALEELEKQG